MRDAETPKTGSSLPLCLANTRSPKKAPERARLPIVSAAEMAVKDVKARINVSDYSSVKSNSAYRPCSE